MSRSDTDTRQSEEVKAFFACLLLSAVCKCHRKLSMNNSDLKICMEILHKEVVNTGTNFFDPTFESKTLRRLYKSLKFLRFDDETSSHPKKRKHRRVMCFWQSCSYESHIYSYAKCLRSITPKQFVNANATVNNFPRMMPVHKQKNMESKFFTSQCTAKSMIIQYIGLPVWTVGLLIHA